MKKLKKKKLNEAVVTSDELKNNIDDLVGTAKDSLDIDDTSAKDFVSGIVGETNTNTDTDKYREYLELMKRLVDEGGLPMSRKDIPEPTDKTGRLPMGRKNIPEPTDKTGRLPMGRKNIPSIDEDGTNNQIKLKADVTKLMSKLDMSSITPYLKKIDNAVEQAEVIAQFAEKIGVPKSKLSAVISQLKNVAESKVMITKKELVERVIKNRRVIKTIKVKDIK